MKLTRSNYESWFLDFPEGNLDGSNLEEFQVFLKENPDLASELEMSILVKLCPDNAVKFDDKEQLKKSVSDQQVDFEEQVVAYQEGDLSKSERIEFETWLSEHPASFSSVEQFGRLKLKADKTIAFEYKDQLKKRGAILPLWIKVASVAAILLLAYLLIQPEIEVRPKSNQQVADLKSQGLKVIIGGNESIKVGNKGMVKYVSAGTTGQIHLAVPFNLKRRPSLSKFERNTILTSQPRPTEPEPSQLTPRSIIFDQPNEFELAVMTLKDPVQTSEEVELSELLKVQLAAMRKSDNRDILPTEHLGLSGLQLFAKLSGKRLTARKGNDGIVKSVSFNSRLFAISIPVNR